MTDLAPSMRRIDEIAIEHGFQLTRPTRYLPAWDTVRVETLAGVMEFDAEMLEHSAALWEPIVRQECNSLRKRAGLP